WLKRWWPVVAPAGVSLACAVAFTVQQRELDSLKNKIAVVQSAPALVSTNSLPQQSSAETLTLSADTAEIARLHQRASELRHQIVLMNISPPRARPTNQIASCRDAQSMATSGFVTGAFKVLLQNTIPIGSFPGTAKLTLKPSQL